LYLEKKAAHEADHRKLITDGLFVIEHPVTQLINIE